jgi:hypothetical protein
MDRHTRSAKGCRDTHGSEAFLRTLSQGNAAPGQGETPSRHAATALSSLPAWLAWLPAGFSRPRFVDRESAAGEGRAVEGVNGRLRRVTVRHLDEAKAPRAAGLAVGHDPDRVDAAIGLEELVEVLLRGGKRQVAHKMFTQGSPEQECRLALRSPTIS